MTVTTLVTTMTSSHQALIDLTMSQEKNTTASTSPKKKARAKKLIRMKDPVWLTVDWKRRSSDIMNELGCSAYTVTTARKKYAPKTLRTMGVRSIEDMPDVDWSKSNSELAKKYKCDIGTIRKYRVRVVPETASIRVKNRTNYHLIETMNWHRSNKYIAEELGVSNTAVCILRKKHAPDTMGKHWEREPLNVDWSLIDWRFSNKKLSERHGFPTDVIRYAREVHAQHTLTPKQRKQVAQWFKVDWNRPTRLIAKSMNVSIGKASGRRRIFAPETVGLYALRLKKNRKKKKK